MAGQAGRGGEVDAGGECERARKPVQAVGHVDGVHHPDQSEYGERDRPAAEREYFRAYQVAQVREQHVVSKHEQRRGRDLEAELGQRAQFVAVVQHAADERDDDCGSEQRGKGHGKAGERVGGEECSAHREAANHGHGPLVVLARPWMCEEPPAARCARQCRNGGRGDA